MMIQKQKLINDAIALDVKQSQGRYFEGYGVYFYFKHVEAISELLGVDLENLKREVEKQFNVKIQQRTA